MILDLLIKDENGETVAKLVLLPKEFKTGSKGFFVQDKVTIAGKRYQAQCQMVEIGSKDAGKDAGKDKAQDEDKPAA